jgi:hypothetical protein
LGGAFIVCEVAIAQEVYKKYWVSLAAKTHVAQASGVPDGRFAWRGRGTPAFADAPLVGDASTGRSAGATRFSIKLTQYQKTASIFMPVMTLGSDLS